MTKIKGFGAALVAVLSGLVLFAPLAGAQSVASAEASTSTFLSAGAGAIFSIITSIVTNSAVLGLLALSVGLGIAWSFVRSRGRSSPAG